MPFLRLLPRPAGLLGLAVLLALTCLAAAPASAQAWDEVVQGDPSGDMVALTFDAGSVDGPAAEILQTLRAYGLRLTFFLTGQWVESYPELALQVAADGHELANHSYFHPDFTTLGSEQIAWELEYTNALVEARLGRSTKPWFRPPFGARNQRVLDLAGELGYRSVYWTLDSGDWRTNATAPVVLHRVLSNAGPGDIVVHHVAATATAEALPAIVEGLQERGLRIVTVSELLGLAGPGAAQR
jgi:peptidoglycan/xylan/chitin deacetylase (PgdA/CDA1 family)